MFEEEILIQGSERAIRVETHRGTPIPNVIAPPADEAAKQRYDRIRKRYGKFWSNRKPATGVYNCYGMIFASRRTSIYEDDTMIQRILDEDGFRKLSNQDQVVPGDIVLYRDSERNSILHIAMVMRRRPLSRTDGVGVAKEGGACYALSKWSDRDGEDEHHIEHHCWKDSEVLIEYWTDRAQQ